MIGVTGATGGVGGRVAARLANRNEAMVLLCRNARRAPRLPGARVAVVGSYADSEGLRRALRGVTTLFLVSAREAPDRLAHHVSAVDAAVACGVQRVVYLSFLSAAPAATFTFARDHWATEEHIRGSGLGFTFLRDSLYLDFMPQLVGADGVVRGPAGDGRVAAVARDDVADVAAEVLTSSAHAGRTYDVTGCEAFTMREMALTLAHFARRDIRYQAETLEEARTSRRSSGAPDWEIEGWVTSYAAIASGEMSVVSDTVTRIAGHLPLTLPQYLRTHPAALPR